MNPYLTISIEIGPDVIGRLAVMIPRERWDSPSDVDRFTPREVVAHLADWEPEFLARMKLARTSPGSSVQAYDEGEWAIEHRYAEKDLHEQLALFRSRRHDTAEFIRSLQPEEFELHVLHPQGGRRSISDMANMLFGHDLYHIEQLLTMVEAARP